MSDQHAIVRGLLILEKVDSEWCPFKVRAIPFTGNIGEKEWFCEEMSYITTNTRPAPHCTRNMKAGDRMWIQVTVHMHFWQDYWGECDSEHEFLKIKVIKRIKQ